MRAMAGRGRVVASVTAMAVAVGLTASGASASASAPTAPRVGACYDYTYQQSLSSSSPTGVVPCKGTHTAVTYQVGTVTGAAGKATSPTAPVVITTSGRACQLAQYKLEGFRIELSRVSFTWFVPTQAQWTAGARWFRCDAVLFSGKSYASIPRRFLSFAKSAAGLRAYRRCATKAGNIVACASAHAYRIKTFVRLGKLSAPWPGLAAVKARSYRLCSAALGRHPAFRTWPLRNGWVQAQRFSGCYVAG